MAAFFYWKTHFKGFPKLLAKHNLRRIRLHELGDSNASLLLANSVDLVLIQSWLGHANLRTTTSYAKHRIDAKQPLSEIIGKVLMPNIKDAKC